MNILHLRSSDLFGSPERLIIGQCRHLPQFHFVCASYVRSGMKPKFLAECEQSGFATIGLQESFTGDVRVIGQLRKVLVDQAVDLIISHDYKSTFYSYWAANGLPMARLAYYHGVTSEDFKVKIYNAIDSFMLKRTPNIIAVSEHTKRLLISRGIDGRKIFVVPNAIDATSLSDNPPPRTSDGPVKLIAAGRFSYEKGVDLLLESVAALLPSTPSFVLYLYGRGPEEDRLRDLAHRLKLDNHVHFMGFIDDIRPIFRTMDALVMSSRSEGMPLIILEAWAEHLGVLATAVGGIPEIISDKKSGLIVPANDTKSLAFALRQVIENREVMWGYGDTGYIALKEQFSFDEQAKQLADIYISCAVK